MERMVGVSPAAIVHATAALYLDLGGRDLRDALAMGFSLADVAEFTHLTQQSNSWAKSTQVAG